MNAADRKAVEQAKNGKAGKVAKTGRSEVNAGQGVSTIQTKLDEARQTVRKSTKNYIVGGGIADALSDIAAGDFGDVGDQVFSALDSFVNGLDNVHLTLEAAENDPKFLPAGEFSGTSPSLYSSTIEADGN